MLALDGAAVTVTSAMELGLALSTCMWAPTRSLTLWDAGALVQILSTSQAAPTVAVAPWHPRQAALLRLVLLELRPRRLPTRSSELLNTRV